MKTALIYASVHHGNTKKLVDAISKEYDITVINATQNKTYDLSEYDRIGFASGIYYSKFHKNVLSFAESNLPEGKRVFFLFTAGAMGEGKTKSIIPIVKSKNSVILGQYGCPGFDTYGPFKLFGGIAKGHPSAEDIEKAVNFYRSL